MIGRRAALKIGEAYETLFPHETPHALRDFFFEHDYPESLIDSLAITPKETIKHIHISIAPSGMRSILIREAPKDRAEGNAFYEELLRRLAEDILNEAEDAYNELKPVGNVIRRTCLDDDYRFSRSAEVISGSLIKCLELDGYRKVGRHLLRPDGDAVANEQEVTVLRELYRHLALGEEDVTFHHLDLTDEHYLESNWEDCIAAMRRVLESILKQSAIKIQSSGGPSITDRQLSQPVRVRDYLEQTGLFTTSEKEAIAKVYGLMSSTGSHPYIADRDQARLLKNLGLSLSQFTLLKLQGKLVP